MSTTNDTLAMVRDVLAKAGDINSLAKAATFSQPGTATTGLQPYDLEAPAKNLVPYLSPLRNRIPRVSGRGGIQANWKAVTAVNAAQMSAGIAEGRRGGLIGIDTADYLAAYRTIGLEASVTFEAELAGGDFDDLRARAQTSLLQTMMVEEEKIILGGNATLALGATPTPTLTTAATGGTITDSTTCSVVCVALTFDAYRRTTAAGGVHQTYQRPNQDGTTETVNGGAGIPATSGPLATGAAGGNTNAITARVTPVRGATGYAWYIGTVGNERLSQITTVARATFTVLPLAPAQLASSLVASDYSKDGMIFDGLLTMAFNPALNAYFAALPAGGTLTPDGAGGVVEFDDCLQRQWDLLRIVPDRILISSQEARTLKKLIVTQGTATSLARFTFQQVQGQLVAGGNARGYLTTFGDQREIPFEQHPYMPPGTVLFETDTLPYAMNNVTNVMQIRARRDYYSMEWPLRTRSYEYGVYSDEVFQHYFPPSLGVVTNITPS